MTSQNPPSWLNEAPLPSSPDEYGGVIPFRPRREGSAEHERASAGPTPKMAHSATVTHITGIDRFDIELESWLNSRQWHVRFNLLSHQLEIHRPSGIVPMSDERLSEIRFTLVHASNGKEPSKDKIADAVSLIGERRAYHPIRDYLASLEWDGIPRLNAWLIDYAGAADNDLNRAFARKMLCAAVRRVKQPGCKFDHVLVLQGRQDLGKSSLIQALCRDHDWFTDQAKVGADAKETIERTSGAWIAEFAELDGLNRRESNAVKSYITTTSDRARLAYGRYTVTRPRQFVLFGTTNESAFLSDLTGNRRWWIVPVAKCDMAGLAAIRDQLWAESVQAEPDEPLWLDSEALKIQAATITDASADRGPWFEILAGRIPDGALKIAASDLWRLVGIEPQSVNKIALGHRASLRKALAGLGFDPEPKNVRRNGRQVHAYLRGSFADARWWSASSHSQEDW